MAQLLPTLGEVVATDRSRLDLTRLEETRDLIRSLRPDLIVNTAAYTNVDRAESEEAVARIVNAEAPGVMAEEAARSDAVLLHYSTDYVFDGNKGEPYLEEDQPNPLNVYGRTKLAGEEAVRRAGALHLIIRTAWVYDREGRNFLRTILRLATQRKELRIVQDQIGAPTWSWEIAQTSVQILRQMCVRGSLRDAFAVNGGTYHMTASGETSWFGFAKAILEEASDRPQSAGWVASATEERPLVASTITPITTPEYPTPAGRPRYSVLSNSRLKQVFGAQLPGWRCQLHSAFAKDTGQ